MSKFYLLPYSEWPEEEKEKKRNFARAWINIKENKLRRYQTSLLKFYNLTWENYVKILEQQEYLCAICGKQLVVPGQGEYNGNSILKESDILKIYDLIKKGFNNEEISKIYNINFRTVSQIRTGFRWNYLFKKHFTKSIKSRNSKYSMEICIKIINELLNTNKKNIEISREYNIEASLISRVRSKDTWLNVWDFYNRNATTIENT